MLSGTLKKCMLNVCEGRDAGPSEETYSIVLMQIHANVPEEKLGQHRVRSSSGKGPNRGVRGWNNSEKGVVMELSTIQMRESTSESASYTMKYSWRLTFAYGRKKSSRKSRIINHRGLPLSSTPHRPRGYNVLIF